MHSKTCKRNTLFIIPAIIVFLAFSMQECLNAQNVTSVSSQEFFDNYLHLLDDEDAVVIDGRTHEMFSGGHLKNAINIDADDPNLIPLLQPHLESPILVIYCTTVRRTTKIVNTLRGKYEGEIVIINDGIRGWLRNGLPIAGISQSDIE